MADQALRAEVELWGRGIGAVAWDPARQTGVFAYNPDFVRSGIAISPIMLPPRLGNFSFPELSFQSFHGLPGFLADSLPDKFGNLLIDAWLAKQGRTSGSMNPIERLCYTGRRGMGALEFLPSMRVDGLQGNAPVQIERLVGLANDVVAERLNLEGHIGTEDDGVALRDILRVGTSAGGARAKAVLAWNPETGAFRSGQLDAEPGFQHWLMKFDGISNNSDKEAADPQGFGRMEYACYKVALAAGVTMSDCRLHEEGGRAHFMTRRFDRDASGRKVHMLTLAAMRHFDFNIPRAYSYEQAIQTLKMIKAPKLDIVEQVRRAFLNVVIRNQDDHVKNIAYLMDRKGNWSLSPAYDVGYAYNPSGLWTAEHQMSLNGKTTGFTRSDLLALAAYADIKPRQAENIFDQVLNAVKSWGVVVDDLKVPEHLAIGAWNGFRLDLPLN